ncbi:MAG: substrate-binding domain-containing protein [Opitutaceae bacterium]
MKSRGSAQGKQEGIQYRSLVDQVVEQLRTAIDEGRWQQRLPGERALVESMHVSRRTIRNALARLCRDGIITSAPGVGHGILRQKKTLPGKPVTREVLVLLKEPLHTLRPFTVLWLDHLRAGLARKGVAMEIVVGKRMFANSPARALARLTSQRPGRIWLVVQSHKAIQVWFQKAGIPCILPGSPAEEVQLPSVDLDHRALCRHAVTNLWRLGHRRIAYLTWSPLKMGDQESEEGFLEGWKQLAGDHAPARIHRFAPEPEQAARSFERIFSGAAEPPTGVIVAQSGYYLTLLSVLASLRLRVPNDVSVVARDNESFFRFLRPEPAAYECPPTRMALALQRLVMDAIAGAELSGRVRIMPEFNSGGSIRKLDQRQPERRLSARA